MHMLAYLLWYQVPAGQCADIAVRLAPVTTHKRLAGCHHVITYVLRWPREHLCTHTNTPTYTEMSAQAPTSLGMSVPVHTLAECTSSCQAPLRVLCEVCCVVDCVVLTCLLCVSMMRWKALDVMRLRGLRGLAAMLGTCADNHTPTCTHTHTSGRT